MNKQDNDRMYAAMTQQKRETAHQMASWNETKEKMDWDRLVNRMLLMFVCFLVAAATALACVELYLKIKNSGNRTTNVLEVKLGGGK
jgi:hypothetical protein